MPVRRLLVIGIGVLFVISGCTSTSPQPPREPVKDPASLSSSEVAQVMGDCLEDKGWDVLRGRTSTGYNGPPEQSGAFQSDLWACYEELGFADVKPPTYTAEHLAKKYEEETETRLCLIAQGLDVPELPSVQAYTDLFFNKGKIYSSYEYLFVGDQSGADALREICGDPLESWSR